jgi:hypothetical protein
MSEFKIFKKALQEQFKKMTENNETLFVTGTDKDEMWNIYLNSFPEGTNPIFIKRTEHDCSCCRSFIKNFGNVVIIKDNKLISIWDINEDVYPYNIISKKLSEYVKSKPIVDIYLSKEKSVGTNNNKQLLENGTVNIWEHFFVNIPNVYINKSTDSIESVKNNYRTSKEVFKRSMDELTLNSGNTILELIEQGSLYRGDEFKKSIICFISLKNQYDNITDEEKDIWCWKNSINNPVSRIRNTAIGVLLIDLSKDVDINETVSKFETVMAPTNYKRPKAIYTKKMIDDAEIKIQELGLETALGRKFAILEDVSVNDVLFVNRDIKKKLKNSVFDELKDEVSNVNVKNFDKVEEINIEDFIKNVLPQSTNIELLFENKHTGNLMSLIAPKDPKSGNMFKWKNNFSWTYNGDIADSIKQNVKNAGGKVDGVLRFSIQWNENSDNRNDFDAHCIEPNGNEIYYGHKINYITTGNLDVDIIHPNIDQVAVENITWTDIRKMENGRYKFFVRNFSHRGGISGFKAEIEYGGQIYNYDYQKELKGQENVIVAEIEFNKETGIKFIKSLDNSMSSKEVWGIKTNNFNKVSVLMLSPNYWNNESTGNKHYFFFLNGCKNENSARGFYNEFLKEELIVHKRVFEALGSKMRVDVSDDQMSGLGFSSTQRENIIVKVEGNFTRVLKILF